MHRSETTHPLRIRLVEIASLPDLVRLTSGYDQVCLIQLPLKSPHRRVGELRGIGETISNIALQLGPNATLISLGEMIDLVHIQSAMDIRVRYQSLISIKKLAPEIPADLCSLPEQHIGALIHTRYDNSLKHADTRVQYTYCPYCRRTTKDYGGKKHTYHNFGTLISDVWRDIAVLADSNIRNVIERFADLFGIEPYDELLVIDCRNLDLGRVNLQAQLTPLEADFANSENRVVNQLYNGDCLDVLRNQQTNSVDFVFADPPYNLKKKYASYSDDLSITRYFNWCDEWIDEVARVLRPGGTFAILNIPLWAIRHFIHLETILVPQNWITWDALSFPVRKIMPANYTILCFSKGQPRPLPGLVGMSGVTKAISAPLSFASLKPLAENYCLRSDCVANRKKAGVNDRETLSDLWWDIHRLKHNSKRVDHPTQLPPHLMYRLISIFTQENEVVLDCFNGSGTTTLAASQLGRRYIGIEIDPNYHRLAVERHQELSGGLDPFRKQERELTAKNSRVPRLTKQKYEVSKKQLQLEVKRVAEELGYLPTREDVIRLGRYSIEYYDNYFSSWGEVCAAARTTGMTEYPENFEPEPRKPNSAIQLTLDLD